MMRQDVRRRGGTPPVFLLLSFVASIAAADPYLDEIVSFTPGSNAGFGQEHVPDIVLGPPQGVGDLVGSFDTLSLGNGGSIVIAFRDNGVCDGPGPDFTIFENAFHAGDPTGPIFNEVGIVAVSEDGIQFVEFPFEPSTTEGLAGNAVVYSHPENGIDPLNPDVSGGDVFDLAEVSLSKISFIRITDPGDAIADAGNRVPPGVSGGFDLDAIAALHSCAPDQTVTPKPTPSPSPSPTPAPLSGRHLLIAEFFDGDHADLASAMTSGAVRIGPEADVNRDSALTAADLVPLSIE